MSYHIISYIIPYHIIYHMVPYISYRTISYIISHHIIYHIVSYYIIYIILTLASVDIYVRHCTNANGGHSYIENVGYSFSRVLAMIDRAAPHLPHNSPKPFTTSYKTISTKHQVTAFERPSLSPDLISENVSFSSGYKSRWNGHCKWSGGNLTFVRAAKRKSSFGLGTNRAESHVRRARYGEECFRNVLVKSHVGVSVHTECQGWGFRCFLIRPSIIPGWSYIDSRVGCLPINRCLYHWQAGTATFKLGSPFLNCWKRRRRVPINFYKFLIKFIWR
jgi:hypothetical protein